MNFHITLQNIGSNPCIPINYQYPLASALYRIIAKGDEQYAAFLHKTGYGKGFKFFTFSQIACPFLIKGDRMHLQANDVSFRISFHLPETMENFIKGLFQSEQIEIADKKSRAAFTVKSISTCPDPLASHQDNELINVSVKPTSQIVAGPLGENKKHEYLSPADHRFTESLVYNWRSKIATCYDEDTARHALLLMETVPVKGAFKPRLITIKANTPEEAKVKGWLNFELKITAEKRFVALLLNAGAGLSNAMGFGGLEVVEK